MKSRKVRCRTCKYWHASPRTKLWKNGRCEKHTVRVFDTRMDKPVARNMRTNYADYCYEWVEKHGTRRE